MENEFWFETRGFTLLQILLHPPLCCVISVSDSSAHFVAEFLHCSVKSKLYSLQPWDTPLRDPLLKTEPIRQEVLSMTVFLHSNYFPAFPLHHRMKWGGARDVDSPIRMYRYVFKKISWNIEIHSEVLLSYKSFVTSSDA